MKNTLREILKFTVFILIILSIQLFVTNCHLNRSLNLFFVKLMKIL
jgi:hypothetical protein